MSKRKSSIDLEEPVVMQGANVEEPITETVIETEAEKPAEKAKTKAEKTVEKKRGVLICVL